jgi:hypothetical protein
MIRRCREWHLRELKAQLARGGWQVVGVHDGDEHRVSASWEIERGKQHLFLDFEAIGAVLGVRPSAASAP